MNKNIMALILTILSAFGAPAVIDEVTDTTPAPEIVLDAPDECEVGELVRLTYAARKVEWKLPGDDWETNEQRAWISFREPGSYQVIVSGLVDNDVRLVAHEINVKGLEPTPAPLPVPTPDVSVLVPDNPVPTPEPLKPEFDITAKVVEWCEKARTPPEVARSLGDNFIVAASTETNTSDLMLNVANRNREADQTGAKEVLVKIQIWMIDNLTGTDFVTHQCAFSEIGDGFLQYAKGN